MSQFARVWISYYLSRGVRYEIVLECKWMECILGFRKVRVERTLCIESQRRGLGLERWWWWSQGGSDPRV